VVRRPSPGLAEADELSGVFDLTGPVVFIPGGYGGIGAAIGRGLARQGVRTAIAERHGRLLAALSGHKVEALIRGHILSRPSACVSGRRRAGHAA
jgi:NAD(P)-dependent dehydrogenase (short-subunit alcohol dehydrogenase family)